MDQSERESLIAYIRSLGMDNFAVMDGVVRLGSRLFNINRCRCGGSDCDGWTLKRLRRGSDLLAQANSSA